MHQKLRPIHCLLSLSLLLSACASSPLATPTPAPTRTPQPPTASPTLTVTPTLTPQLTSTLLPLAPTATLDLPVGTPVSAWLGIPIMPGAIAGDGSKNTYHYITHSSMEQVRDYYIQSLPTLGWKYVQSMPDAPGKYIYVLQADGGIFIYLGGPFNFIHISTPGDYTGVDILYIS